MLSADERAGAALKLRVLKSDLETMSASLSTAERTLFKAERAFAHALKTMRDARRTFDGARNDAEVIRQTIEDTNRALEVGDRAALGGFDIGMLARVQALVAQDLANAAAASGRDSVPAATTSSLVTANETSRIPRAQPESTCVDAPFGAAATRRAVVPPPSDPRSQTAAHNSQPVKVNVAHHMPVELVAEIWRTTAELCIEADRKSVLNIVASCAIGYQAAIPVLYRTLLMTQERAQLAMRIFGTKSLQVAGGSMLSAAPVKRLCPLVRRLCITETPPGFTADHIRQFISLDTLYDSKSMGPFFSTPLPPTLKHFREWTDTWPLRLPRTLTHVTLFYPIGTPRAPDPTWAKAYIATELPDSITHFALSFSDSLTSPPSAEEVIRDLLQSVLARNGIKVVVIRLFRHAVDIFSYNLVQRAIAALRVDDSKRAGIWYDLRPGLNAGDYKPVIADAVANRTPFTEAEMFKQDVPRTTGDHVRGSRGHRGGYVRLNGGRGRGGRR